MDNSRVALVSVKFGAPAFNVQTFKLSSAIARCHFSVNMSNLTKVLKCAKDDDICTLKAGAEADVLNLVYEAKVSLSFPSFLFSIAFPCCGISRPFLCLCFPLFGGMTRLFRFVWICWKVPRNLHRIFCRPYWCVVARHRACRMHAYLPYHPFVFIALSLSFTLVAFFLVFNAAISPSSLPSSLLFTFHYSFFLFSFPHNFFRRCAFPFFILCSLFTSSRTLVSGRGLHRVSAVGPQNLRLVSCVCGEGSTVGWMDGRTGRSGGWSPWTYLALACCMACVYACMRVPELVNLSMRTPVSRLRGCICPFSLFFYPPWGVGRTSRFCLVFLFFFVPFLVLVPGRI